ncbi:hypothetical protein DFH05DRAFT_1545796 [Lentinula detonsa]|uniref:Uncharacterized protein n=1 Tax=Lentinula detonsa TaxID=2804962 RepID=A0A9W8NT62_9AGAR|nr:hypothetical protein DFH05DRAFT_1545796 [Lentinula detonsa]
MNGFPFDVNNPPLPYPGSVDVSLGSGLDCQVFTGDDEFDFSSINYNEFDFSSINFDDPMLVDAFNSLDYGNGMSGSNLGNSDPTAGSRVDTDDPGNMSSFLPSESPSSNLSPASGGVSALGHQNSPASTGNTPSNSISAPVLVPKTGFTSFEPTTHAQRNPLLPTQNIRPHPKRTLDPVQARTMNEAKAEKQRLAMLARDDVLKLATEFEQNVASLAEKHAVSVEYLKGLMSMASKFKRKRAPGRMQALVHLKAKEVNASLPVGGKLKAPALRKLVDEDEALLMISNDKIEQAKREVEEKRLLSIRGIRPTNLSAGKDYSAFSRLVKKEFDALHVRTGAVGFGFLCPGTSDDKGFPAWFVAGNKTADFVRHHLNTTMWDLLLELELWTAKKEKPATVVQIQSQCSVMIASSLRYILKDKSASMNYANYHSCIVDKHHVQLIGLPDSQLFIDANGPIKPFDIKDRKTLDALHAALESGACRWSKMSSEEVKEHGECLQMQVPKVRAVRSDKGKKRGRRTDANNNNNDESQAPPPKRMRHPAKQKARIAKSLPPKHIQRSSEDTDESDGSNGEGDAS